jgi:hypothetical protein
MLLINAMLGFVTSPNSISGIDSTSLCGQKRESTMFIMDPTYFFWAVSLGGLSAVSPKPDRLVRHPGKNAGTDALNAYGHNIL